MISGEQIDRLVNHMTDEEDIRLERDVSAWVAELRYLRPSTSRKRRQALQEAMDRLMMVVGVAEPWIIAMHTDVPDLLRRGLMTIHSIYDSNFARLRKDPTLVINFAYELLIVSNDRFWVCAQLRAWKPDDLDDAHDLISNLLALKRGLRRLISVLEPYNEEVPPI